MQTLPEITGYAEQGMLILSGQYAGQHATMMFRDAARKKWMGVVSHHVSEGEIVHHAGRHCNVRMTWEKA